MRIAIAIMLVTLFVCGIGFAQTSTVGFMHAIHATDNPGVRNVFVKDPGGINIELVESTN
jgi:hypothetical protein